MLKVLQTVTPKSLTIAAGIVNAGLELELPDMVITAGNNGRHKVGSLHYVDRALDFRTKHLTPMQRSALLNAIKRRLGADYDVILEDAGGPNEHGHAEYDPSVQKRTNSRPPAG